MEAGLGVCVQDEGRKLPTLRPGASLVVPAEVENSSCGVEGRRRMYWAHVPEVSGCWVPAVHASCVHNETASLLLRTLGPTPEFPGSVYLFEEYSKLRRLVRRLNVSRWSRERVVESYSGRLRRRYEIALEALRNGEQVTRLDKTISAFLKAEKFNPLLKPSKPRMIMSRGPKYNLELASYLKPLEHALWRSIKGPKGATRATRQVGKGLNADERAAIIEEKMVNLGEATVFEVDGKSFESHVLREDLLLEHSIYLTAYKGDPNLKRLLDVQLVLKGRTTCGVKFYRQGARASGDFNTGLGNTLIMLASVRAGMHKLATDLGAEIRWDTLVDGDNALIFVEQRRARVVHERFAGSVRAVSSQELAVENPVTAKEQVVFGQCKPVFNGTRYVMVRDPYKVISNSFSSYRHYENWAFGLRLVKSISQAELALARGVPVLEPYFAKALELVGNVPDLVDPSRFLEGRVLDAFRLLASRGETLADVKPSGVSASARQSFAMAWGISVEEQLKMEEELTRGLNFPQLNRHMPWWILKRWVRGDKNAWSSVYVSDTRDGEVPSRFYLSYFGERD